MKPEQAEDVIVRNLIEELNRLQHDLDRIEMWTAALDCFRRPAPTYQASNDYLLPARDPLPR
jgi:hypothetical protein